MWCHLFPLPRHMRSIAFFCALLVTITAAPEAYYCQDYECADCVNDPGPNIPDQLGCGWCFTTNTCMVGGPFGPLSNETSCDNQWVWSTSSFLCPAPYPLSKSPTPSPSPSRGPGLQYLVNQLQTAAAAAAEGYQQTASSVMGVMLPEEDVFTVVTNVTSFSVDGSSYCNENGQAVQSLGAAILDFFTISLAMMPAIAKSANVSGAEIGTTAIAPQFQQMMGTAMNALQANGGFGFGVGFDVYCGSTAGTEVFSFGGGGGGGGTNATNFGFGGGGGGEVGASGVSGGGGCNCAGQGAAAKCVCNSQQDSGSNSDLGAMAAAFRAAASGCPSLAICASGGGGGGLLTPNCQFGGGFGIGMQVYLNGAALNQCATSSNAIGEIASACVAQCNSTPNFEACFCPCFRTNCLDQGLTWAATITCTS